MGFFPFFPLPVSGALITPPVNLQSSGTSPVFGAGTTGDTFNRIEMDADGRLRGGPGNGAVDVTWFRSSANQWQSSGTVKLAAGNLDVNAIGSGLQVAEGANAKQGTFVLSGAATTTVANTSVTATSRIILTCQALGTVTSASTLAVSSRVAGTSFTVTPSQATDTSTIAFEIFEPG
jgi:hypothetical protein